MQERDFHDFYFILWFQKYESCLRQQAENTMCQLAQYDATVESLMRKIDGVSDLESFSIQVYICSEGTGIGHKNMP